MQLKITFFLFSFLSPFLVTAQTSVYPVKLFDQKDYYYWDTENLRGDIKKVTTRNFEYTFNKEDSTYVEYAAKDIAKKMYVDTNEIFTFDKRGNLLKSYYCAHEAEPFLYEENKYNEDNQLIFQRRQTRHYRDKKLVVHEEFEKRTYTQSGKLKEVWKKSSYQKDYFIKRKYSYNENDAPLKYETFNAHIETNGYFTCKGSSTPKDYVTIYHYDDANRLLESKQYVYEYRFDSGKESIIQYRDFAAYKLKQITLFEYNAKHLIEKETRSFFYDYQNGMVNVITNSYDSKDRLIERMTAHKAGHGSGYLYEYYEKDGELNKIITIYTEKKIGVHTILKKMGSIKEREKDGFVRIDYSNGRRESIRHYNTYGDEVLDHDLDDYQKQVFQYIYDKKGNWTSRILIENGIKKEKILRELEYYSE